MGFFCPQRNSLEENLYFHSVSPARASEPLGSHAVCQQSVLFFMMCSSVFLSLPSWFLGNYFSLWFFSILLISRFQILGKTSCWHSLIHHFFILYRNPSVMSNLKLVIKLSKHLETTNYKLRPQICYTHCQGQTLSGFRCFTYSVENLKYFRLKF